MSRESIARNRASRGFGVRSEDEGDYEKDAHAPESDSRDPSRICCDAELPIRRLSS